MYSLASAFYAVLCSLDVHVRVAVRPTLAGGSYVGRCRAHPDLDRVADASPGYTYFVSTPNSAMDTVGELLSVVSSASNFR